MQITTAVGRHFAGNAVAYLALVVAMSGTAYAAATIGSADIINGSVRSQDVQDRGIKPLDLSPAPPWRDVGAVGQVPFNQVPGRAWTNETLEGTREVTAFYRDPYGVVHLKGTVCVRISVEGPCGQARIGAGESTIFTLPPGFRPAAEQMFAVWAGPNPDRPSPGPSAIGVRSSGDVVIDDTLEAWLALDGISFRCAPAGTNGCP